MNLPMLIAVRGYASPLRDDAGRREKKWTRKPLSKPSREVLVFDCETTSDHTHNLRFGTYQCRKGGRLIEQGIFYEPDNSAALSEADLAVIRDYAAEHRLTLRTRDEFVCDLFYRYAFRYGALVVGFNLPFDLSRLAVEISTSRARDMRGAFSLKLTKDKNRPAVLVRHLNSKAAFMRFASLGQMDTRSSRKRGIKTKSRTGFFLDIKTLAAAMLGKPHSLASLAVALATTHRKLDAGKHGGPLTPAYLDYAMEDTQVTWECYDKLASMYSANGLKGTPPHRIYSEASFGKACLNEMGIMPLAKTQPDVPSSLLGTIMATYYGGRSEVRIRRDIVRVLYCDFRSMYPTVCTLMGLWQFVTGQNFQWRDWTDDAQALLRDVTLDNLRRKELWRNLPVLVRITPDDDVLPVRAAYDGTSRTIGLNHLTAKFPMWFTLADCIVSKLMTGRSPRIVQALRFTPGPVQEGLKPITLAGGLTIDPAKGDFYRDLIVRRGLVQSEIKQATDPHMREVLDARQMTLKLIANATGYGIFAEQNVQSFDRPRPVTLYGQEAPFRTTSKSLEEPGSHFHPLIATLIAGAARLMLACAESVATAEGLGWAFCDTDSLALARPEGMADAEFLERCAAVTGWFDGLDPYGDGKPLFKVEDQNFALEAGKVTKHPEPLYALAISAKRYVLFNLGPDGRPVIRKALAHGLGHLLEPYGEDEASASISAPVQSLSELGVKRWQYDLWYRIVLAALEGHPDRIDLSGIPGLDRPARSRYGANTAALLGWFRRFNARKPLSEQVKSLNFLLAYQVSKPAFAQARAEGSLDEYLLDGGLPAVVAPYSNDPATAADYCFDRRTGRPVPASILMTYREAIAGYHLHSEAKFENGDTFDRRLTRRRHVEAVALDYIGKEANRWEERFYLGDAPDAQVAYGGHPKDRRCIAQMLRETANKVGLSEFARVARLSRPQLYALINGTAVPRPATLNKLCRAMVLLNTENPRFNI